MAAVKPADPVAEAPAAQEKASVTIKTPFRAPAAIAAKVPPPVELTAEEKTKYDWLLERARAFKEITVRADAKDPKVPSGPITDDERMWLTRECLIRYLRATRFDEKETEKRLLQTLAWRREFGTEGLTADYISPENETGKQSLVGFDETGRPLHYLEPGKQNTEASHRQVEHLVFMVERVIELMPPGQEKLALLINFKQSKTRKYTAPGMGMAREVLNILQMHYPERLGRALIINVPWVVWGFFKLITPFLDARTVDKLRFNEDMTQYISPDQLSSDFQPQGALKFEYDHAEYWPALNKLCDEVRAERKARWVAGGKLVGESEIYLFGGAEAGIGAAAPAAEVKPEDLKVGELKIEEAKGEEPKAEEAKTAA
ncbi:related to PDR16 protein [Cephalotrichum gorgonifer]|uniref:Related to PDR16 protein n=1 Tax=Cephalotrichum gorgonifer TaxID=2041049 RepID=A0AAE8N609_9PEZI|nr:related to PDR16 protein [Cephalotrichum gorgonifer]